MTEQREWHIPTRKELEERVAKYLCEESEPSVSMEDARFMAADLVRIFNQWTVEVVAPEVLEEIDN